MGSTHDQNTLEKWTLTSHLRAAVTTNLKVLCQLDGEFSRNKDVSDAGIRKSQEAVSKILSAMENTSNPSFCFEECEEKSQLVNIFNGILLPNELADQLLDAKKSGTNEVQSFVTELDRCEKLQRVSYYKNWKWMLKQ